MEILDSGLLQRALIEVVILGGACGALGVWLLHLRHAYAAESLAHAMLPGLVLASLAGAPLVLGAGGGVLVAAALVALAPEVPARLGELLFGDVLATTPTDVATAAALAAFVAGALALGHRRLVAAVFDPVAAASLGVAPGRVELALLALLAIAVVAAVQGLGNLLVFALLVAPAAAAIRLGTSVRGQVRLGAALGCAAGFVGLVVSAELDLAAGASVALAAVALYVIAALVRRQPAQRGAARRSPVEALGAPR